MRFKAVSAVEAAESLIYTVLLATLAYLHKGIWCYVIAMGCRDLFGSVAFNLITHPPFRSFSWASLRPHVGFSLVYQGGSLLNMVTLAFPPIMIARLLGKNAVGYVSWAATLSLYPLVICNAMARIYLPAFSSAAGDPALLRSRVEKSLRINASIAWPACAVLASLSTPIIIYVFTRKWLPAQPLALRLLCECGDERGGRAPDGAVFLAERRMVQPAPLFMVDDTDLDPRHLCGLSLRSMGIRHFSGGAARARGSWPFYMPGGLKGCGCLRPCESRFF